MKTVTCIVLGVVLLVGAPAFGKAYSIGPDGTIHYGKTRAGSSAYSNVKPVSKKQQTLIKKFFDDHFEGAMAERQQQGMIAQGVTLVPLRHIAEWLAAKVDFDQATKVITLQLADTTLQLTLGDKKAKIGDQEYNLDVAAMSREGTTYVPLRFVAEGFHTGVEWDAKNRQVVITRSQPKSTLTIPVR